MKKSMDRRTGGATVGSALGVVVVMFLPKLMDITFVANEAAMLTAALGIIFTGVLAYFPKP